MSSNRVAVLFCGELRAWDIASQYLFEFLENHFQNIDYYFCTWYTTRDFWWPEHRSIDTLRSVDPNEITSKFCNRNLINYCLVDINTVTKYNINFYYQAHLLKVCNVLKRRYEFDNKFVYDQVIEVRPDLYFAPHDAIDIINCKDFEFSGTWLDSQCNIPTLNDTYFRTNSFGNDVLSTKNCYNKIDKISKFNDVTTTFDTILGTYNVHWLILDFLMHRRFINKTEECYEVCVKKVVIRPNFPTGNLHLIPIEELYQYNHDFVTNRS